MEFNSYKKELNKLETSEVFHRYIEKMRPICADRKSFQLIQLLNDAIKKSEDFEDRRILVKLYDLKIRQLYSSITELPMILDLHSKMQYLCEKLKYNAGLALVYQLSWHINKLKGNTIDATRDIKRAIEIVNTSSNLDRYAKYFCLYSFAIENWLSNKDSCSKTILEECVDYFYSNHFYHGLAMSLGILIVIYQYTQDKEKSMQTIRRILNNRNLLLKIPEEIQSIIHYFVGVGHKLCFNISKAAEELGDGLSGNRFRVTEDHLHLLGSGMSLAL